MTSSVTPSPEPAPDATAALAGESPAQAPARRRRKAHKPRTPKPLLPTAMEIPSDSLQAVGVVQSALGQLAGRVMRGELTPAQRADAKLLLAVADRMAKLTPTDRLRAAEAALRADADRIADTRPSPEMRDAPDLAGQPGQVTARRGRPARR